MIVLNTTSDIVQITTTTANALDVHVTYVDNVTAAPYTSARQNTAIASSTTTTVLSSPAASTQRQLKVLTAVAKGGANAVTPKLFDGTTTFNLFGNGISLLPNETLSYEDARGWFVLDALGQVKQVGATGPTGPTGSQGLTGPAGFAYEPEEPQEPLLLRGIQGPVGGQGPQGVNGPPGGYGSDGDDGNDAIPISGPQGIQGIQGLQGLQGVQGLPGADPDDPESPMQIPGIQGPPGLGIVGPQGIPGGIPAADPEEPEASWIALPPTTSPAIVPPSRLPIQLQSLDLWGHSYLDDPLTSQTIGALATNDTNNFGYLYAAAVGIPRGNVRNHAISGSYLTNIGYGGANGAGGNFPKFLVELTDPKTQTLPFTRMGGAHLICTGSNDIGANTAANQALTRATAQDILIYIIARMRASAWFSAQSATNQAFGANWTNAAPTAIDWTSGLAKVCSTVDSAGTSTVTFTIPYGYKGEPICFGISSQLSATSMQITWGGNITGTSGIIGTVSTLSSRSVNANGIVGFRWTGPTNGLSAANAGQTFTFKLSAVTAQSCWYDGVVIEAFKPAAVLICNQPRLPQKTFNLALGDGVTTGVNTSFTSATGGQFATTGGWRQLAAAPITETDAQGAFTGSANTVGSVTNATTLVLGSNAAAAKTSIQCTVQTTIFGYNSGLYSPLATNTNWTGATTASHSAADTDVTNWNAMIATVAALFDSMVQVVDMDGAIGSDTNVPSTAYSFFCTDGYHPNNLGQQYVAQAVWTAAQKLAMPTSDVQNIGVMQVAASPSYIYAPNRRIRNSGKSYTGDYSAIIAGANLAANNFWAIPIMVTEPTEFWGAISVQTTTAPTAAATTLRCAWYDDVNGLGYPQSLRVEPTLGGTVALPATAPTIVSLGSVGRPVHTGLHWLCLKVDAVGATPGVLLTMAGPSEHMPGYTGATGMTAGPVAWLATGVAGIMPSRFPSGAALVTSCPLASVVVTTQ
jgi:hypothetical protein